MNVSSCYAPTRVFAWNMAGKFQYEIKPFFLVSSSVCKSCLVGSRERIRAGTRVSNSIARNDSLGNKGGVHGFHANPFAGLVEVNFY